MEKIPGQASNRYEVPSAVKEQALQVFGFHKPPGTDII